MIAATVAAGVLACGLGKGASDSSGKTTFLGTVEPAVGVSLRLGSERIYAEPGIALAPLGRKGIDASSRTRTFAIGLPLALAAGPLFARAGPAYELLWIKGAGGSAELKNGTSTKTFALPSGSSWARAFAVQLGLGARIARFRLSCDSFISAPFREKREVSALAALGFSFP